MRTLTYYGLKGKVSEVDTYQVYNDPVFFTGQLLSNELIFDNNGLLLSERCYRLYHSSSEVSEINDYEYDNNGNLLVIIENRMKISSWKKSKVIYSYDKQNNLVEVVVVSDSERHTDSEYIYNANNQCIEDRIYSSGKKLYFLENHNYDSNGMLVRSERQEIPSKIRDITIYNLNRKPIELKHLYDDKLTSSEINMYNNEGLLSCKKVFNENNIKTLVYYETYEYNDDGLIVIQQNLDGNDDPKEKTEYEYSEKGDLVCKVHSSFELNLQKKEFTNYQNDEMGNWIEEIVSSSDTRNNNSETTFNDKFHFMKDPLGLSKPRIKRKTIRKIHYSE